MRGCLQAKFRASKLRFDSPTSHRSPLMSVVFPELKKPIEVVAACLTVPLDEHPEVRDLFPDKKTQHFSRCNVGGVEYFVRLLVELFNPSSGHFHLDIAQPWAGGEEANVPIEFIASAFQRLVGKSLRARFESRIRIPRADVSKASLLGAWRGVGLNVGGITGTLTAANIRLSDTVYKEIRWKPTDFKSDSPFLVELVAVLDRYPITADLLLTANRHIEDGLRRFITGQLPAADQQSR